MPAKEPLRGVCFARSWAFYLQLDIVCFTLGISVVIMIPLRDTKMYDYEISFHSLHTNIELPNSQSLFIHVPPFKVITSSMLGL